MDLQIINHGSTDTARERLTCIQGIPFPAFPARAVKTQDVACHWSLSPTDSAGSISGRRTTTGWLCLPRLQTNRCGSVGPIGASASPPAISPYPRPQIWAYYDGLVQHVSNSSQSILLEDWNEFESRRLYCVSPASSFSDVLLCLS